MENYTTDSHEDWWNKVTKQEDKELNERFNTLMNTPKEITSEDFEEVFF